MMSPFTHPNWQIGGGFPGFPSTFATSASFSALHLAGLPSACHSWVQLGTLWQVAGERVEHHDSNDATA